jgi:hypothetical protein
MHQPYIYVADIDESPCVTDKKQRISGQLDGNILDENVAVVIKEIEAWYLAGASSKMRILLNSRIKTTDAVTKEQFDKLVPGGMPRAQLMEEILDDFDLRIAPTRNRSLAYFVRKWVD